MTDNPLATDIFFRWRDGDPDAARQLFEIYARQLALLAGKHLSERLARRVDGEDIVQSVFRTFFRRSARGEFPINNSDELWQLLVHITLAKVRSQARRHTAARRSVRNEEIPPAEWLPEACTAQPGPVEAVILMDQIETILHGLPGLYADILALSLEGFTRTETAEKVGVSRQTVHRVLNLLRERLQRSVPESP